MFGEVQIRKECLDAIAGQFTLRSRSPGPQVRVTFVEKRSVDHVRQRQLTKRVSGSAPWSRESP